MYLGLNNKIAWMGDVNESSDNSLNGGYSPPSKCPSPLQRGMRPN